MSKRALLLIMVGIICLSVAACRQEDEEVETPLIKAPRQLFPEWTHSGNPLLRSDSGGTLYLAWRERFDYSYNQAFYSSSRDGGATWTQVLNISRSREDVEYVDLAADDAGHVYMSWYVFSTATGSRGIYFCRSLDYGATWSAVKKMPTAGENVAYPAIAVDSRGDVLLVWYLTDDKGEVAVMRLASSGDRGATWGIRDFSVSVPGQVGLKSQPFLACGRDGTVLLLSGVIVANPAGYGLVCYASADNGDSWQTQQVHIGSGMLFAIHPLARFTSDGRLCVVWGDYQWTGHNTNYWNYFMRRENSGAWSAPQLLNDFQLSRDGKAGLAAVDGRADVALVREDGLWVLRSADAGDSWSQPVFVEGSGRPRYFYSPDLLRLPSGKTILVAVCSTVDYFVGDGSLYLTSFD